MEERDAIGRLRRGDMGGLEFLARQYQVRAVRAAYLVTRAAQVASAVAALRASVGSAIDPVDRPVYAHSLAQIADALGPGRFAECWAAGQALSLEHAIAYALAAEK